MKLLLSLLILIGFTVTAQAEKLSEIKIIGFLQEQFLYDQSEGTIENLFKTKRARLGIAGTVLEKFGYNLVIGALEPPDKTPRLVNAFIDFKSSPWLNLRAGQSLLPFGLEGREMIFQNPAIERSTAIRKLNAFRMFRDFGIILSGSVNMLDYGFAVVNGTGANIAEENDKKDVLGRIGISPLKDLNFGFSGHLGKFADTTGTDLQRIRYNIDSQLKHQVRMLLFKLRGEYEYRQDEMTTGPDRESTGWYALISVTTWQRIEALVRYELYDPDKDASDDELKITTLGANFYLKNHSRLSANYEFRNDAANPDIGNLLTMQLQVVF